MTVVPTRAALPVRRYGVPPFAVALLHGGPGAAGELAPLARGLAERRGVLEPLQTADSVEGQVEELRGVLEAEAALPATLVGFSWGAWLACFLAARHPKLVRKLVLVSSAPFEERWVADMKETQRDRLTPAEQAELARVSAHLAQPGGGPGQQAAFRRLGELSTKADACDPLEADSGDQVRLDLGIYRGVWPEAARLRRTGALLHEVGRIVCPAVAIHGDHDPHPAEGVRAPLAARLRDFRFILLSRCGHRPWLERHARDEFLTVLERELE